MSDHPFRFKMPEDAAGAVIVIGDYTPERGMYVTREEAERMTTATGCTTDCPLCDMDRAKHDADCPADILAKLAADVAEGPEEDV